MADFERGLDSAEKSTESTVNKDPGAGTNADSRADMVFVATSPLSELVWPPQKGLSLKYADSSSSSKKASLIWNTESFNIMVVPPKCFNSGEGSSTRTLAEGNLNPVQLEQISDSKRNHRVMLTSSPQSTSGVQLVSWKMASEQKGACNVGQSSDSLPCDLELLRPELKQADEICTSTVRTSPDHVRELSGVKTWKSLGMPEVSGNVDSMLVKHGNLLKSASSPKDAQCGHCDLSFNHIECSMNVEMTHQLDSFNVLGEKCSVRGDSAYLRDKNGFSTTAIPWTYDGIEDDIGKASYNDKPALTSAVVNTNINSSNLVERNKHINYDAEDSRSLSKESANSHESVESSNSKELISTGKRAGNSEPEMSAAHKRLKKEIDENCEGPLHRKDSSFMNWISTMMNGFSGSEQATRSVAPTPQFSYQNEVNCSSPPASHDKGKNITCRNMGFQSIFQALYCSSSKVEETARSGFGHQRVFSALKEQDASMQLGYRTHHESKDDMDVNLQNAVPLRSKRIRDDVRKVQLFTESINCDGLHIDCHRGEIEPHVQSPTSSEKLKQGSAPVEELLSFGVNDCSVHLLTNKKIEYDIEKNCMMGSPDSSTHNGSRCPPERKATSMLGPAPNMSSNLVTDSRNNYLQSLWVTRISPKLYAHLPKSEQCNQGRSSTVDRYLNYCNSSHHPSQNDVAPDREDNNSRNCCHPLESQRHACIQDNSASPVSCGSKLLETDQKLKSKLSPILPSPRFNKSQPMASVFAKRLDALRHIVIPKPLTDATCAKPTCFFCGKNGHDLRECSDLVESDLVDLLNNMNSYGCTGKLSCICIWCFQLNHWAISCPLLSSKRKGSDKSNIFVVNSEYFRAKEKTEYPSASYDRRIILWTGDEQEHHQHFSAHQIPQKGETSVKSMDFEIICAASMPNAKDSNSVDEDLKESPVKMKQSSNSGEIEPKRHQTNPLCYIFPTEVIDLPNEIFESVRKLRLSRSDVIRWMKSPDSHFILEGFFLRLRLGKWEEELGGTGYYVARVNGVSCGNCLSVSIGDFQCEVDCRFVSNDDFKQDELIAWWTASLRGNGKLPSRDELNQKVEERIKFQFETDMIFPPKNL